MKKWQKAFVNHIEAIRNTDSPLNGSRVSSPQFNGSIRDSDSLPGTPTSSEGLEKFKSTEGKKRGLKRKREGSSSSESSPVVFGKHLEGGIKSRTETPTGVDHQGVLQDITSENIQSQADSSCSVSNSSVSQQASPLATIHIDKNVKPQTERERPEVFISETENGDVSEQQVQSPAAKQHSDVIDGDPSQSEQVGENCDGTLSSQDNVCNVIKQPDISDNTVEEPEMKTELVGTDEDSPKPDLPPLRPPKSPSEMELEVSAQASGINGHFGPDGVWYDWTEIMPSNEGLLNILPYVLLE